MNNFVTLNNLLKAKSHANAGLFVDNNVEYSFIFNTQTGAVDVKKITWVYFNNIYDYKTKIKMMHFNTPEAAISFLEGKK